jgi:hypothetical protein
VTSTAALGVSAMFPDLLPLWAWAALHATLGFVIVGIGRYGLFEQIMNVIPQGYKLLPPPRAALERRP